MTEYFNRKEMTPRRRDLRNHAPEAEARLWTRLKGKQLGGYKFRRQYSIGSYVLDFYCPALKLAVEIDGPSHFQPGAAEYDVERQGLIERFGIRFLRFTNTDVYTNLSGVLTCIAETAITCNPATDAPPE